VWIHSGAIASIMLGDNAGRRDRDCPDSGLWKMAEGAIGQLPLVSGPVWADWAGDQIQQHKENVQHCH
jgi:hypothetical protein